MKLFSYVNLRRISQILFLLLFLFLVFNTQFRGGFNVKTANKLKYPARLFLDTDPLLALGTLISSGQLYGWLAAALIVIIPTFFLGRIYCGWICPFGTIHNGCSSYKPIGTLSERIKNNRYN